MVDFHFIRMICSIRGAQVFCCAQECSSVFLIRNGSNSEESIKEKYH